MTIMIHACNERMWYVNEYLVPSMTAQGIGKDNIIVVMNPETNEFYVAIRKTVVEEVEDLAYLISEGKSEPPEFHFSSIWERTSRQYQKSRHGLD